MISAFGLCDPLRIMFKLSLACALVVLAIATTEAYQPPFIGCGPRNNQRRVKRSTADGPGTDTPNLFPPLNFWFPYHQQIQPGAEQGAQPMPYVFPAPPGLPFIPPMPPMVPYPPQPPVPVFLAYLPTPFGHPGVPVQPQPPVQEEIESGRFNPRFTGMVPNGRPAEQASTQPTNNSPQSGDETKPELVAPSGGPSNPQDVAPAAPSQPIIRLPPVVPKQVSVRLCPHVLQYGPSCDQFHQCYADCSKTKAQCDQEFHDSMMVHCEETRAITTPICSYYCEMAARANFGIAKFFENVQFEKVRATAGCPVTQNGEETASTEENDSEHTSENAPVKKESAEEGFGLESLFGGSSEKTPMKDASAEDSNAHSQENTSPETPLSNTEQAPSDPTSSKDASQEEWSNLGSLFDDNSGTDPVKENSGESDFKIGSLFDSYENTGSKNQKESQEEEFGLENLFDSKEETPGAKQASSENAPVKEESKEKSEEAFHLGSLFGSDEEASAGDYSASIEEDTNPDDKNTHNEVDQETHIGSHETNEAENIAQHIDSQEKTETVGHSASQENEQEPEEHTGEETVIHPENNNEIETVASQEETPKSNSKENTQSGPENEVEPESQNDQQEHEIESEEVKNPQQDAPGSVEDTQTVIHPEHQDETKTLASRASKEEELEKEETSKSKSKEEAGETGAENVPLNEIETGSPNDQQEHVTESEEASPQQDAPGPANEDSESVIEEHATESDEVKSAQHDTPGPVEDTETVIHQNSQEGQFEKMEASKDASVEDEIVNEEATSGHHSHSNEHEPETNTNSANQEEMPLKDITSTHSGENTPAQTGHSASHQNEPADEEDGVSGEVETANEPIKSASKEDIADQSGPNDETQIESENDQPENVIEPEETHAHSGQHDEIESGQHSKNQDDTELAPKSASGEIVADSEPQYNTVSKEKVKDDDASQENGASPEMETATEAPRQTSANNGHTATEAPRQTSANNGHTATEAPRQTSANNGHTATEAPRQTSANNEDTVNEALAQKSASKEEALETLPQSVSEDETETESHGHTEGMTEPVKAESGQQEATDPSHTEHSTETFSQDPSAEAPVSQENMDEAHYEPEAVPEHSADASLEKHPIVNNEYTEDVTNEEDTGPVPFSAPTQDDEDDEDYNMDYDEDLAAWHGLVNVDSGSASREQTSPVKTDRELEHVTSDTKNEKDWPLAGGPYDSEDKDAWY